ncbi:WXG100 family type VII secretion target [Amycolatopsis anabasis]|uniref:WXG100 family type VII secretion target n=1 Tax=Amycolatopsis anabasis TaxID=1840409 RepID=UPI00131AE5C4|nr:hypothetical protein [Amycolatopsis anabasis]
MDATASSGGPITILPQIVTGSPEQIFKHVTELLKKATEFTNLMTEFVKAAEQLEKVWSGEASESALKKIADSIASLNKIIEVVRKGAELLGISGTLVKAAQEAYRAVVSAVNPTVASLMSNPWTYGAAVALSTATSASLRAFIQAIGALLKALGVVDLANQVNQLATIIAEIEKLFGGGDKSGDRSGGAAGNAAVGGSPVTAPQSPPPVAGAAGQQVVSQVRHPDFTGYVPPALAPYQGSGVDSWIPVNRAPVDRMSVDIDLEFTVDGKEYEQHIDIETVQRRS